MASQNNSLGNKKNPLARITKYLPKDVTFILPRFYIFSNVQGEISFEYHVQ